jgi:predicted nucleic-acid-binding protein
MSNSIKYLPDTNTILRYLLQDHPELSSRAADFWNDVRNGAKRAVLTEGVLLECVYVLQRFYKVPRDTISEILSALLVYKGVECSDGTLVQESLSLYGTCSLDFVDCMLAIRHTRQEGILFSFDEKLCRLAEQRRV